MATSLGIAERFSFVETLSEKWNDHFWISLSGPITLITRGNLTYLTTFEAWLVTLIFFAVPVVFIVFAVFRLGYFATLFAGSFWSFLGFFWGIAIHI